MMKVLIFLSASLFLGNCEYFVPAYEAANDRDLCSLLLWAVSSRDPCKIGMIESMYPGAWRNSSSACEQTTPLHEAAASGSTALVRALLAQGTPVNAQDSTGRTPLFRVLNRVTNPSVAFELLFSGADPNIVDHNGDSPLHAVILHALQSDNAYYNSRDPFKNEREVMLQLLVAGADRSIVNSKGQTCVSIASDARMDLTALLLGNKNITISYPRETCSGYSDSNYHNMIREENANGKDWCGRNELRHSYLINSVTSYHKNSEVSNFINKANVEGKDVFSESILHLAARRGTDEFVSELLAAGADINARDWLGQTPLHLASMCKRQKVVEILLKAKGDLAVKDNFGRTPDDLKNNVFPQLPSNKKTSGN